MTWKDFKRHVTRTKFGQEEDQGEKISKDTLYRVMKDTSGYEAGLGTLGLRHRLRKGARSWLNWRF